MKKPIPFRNWLARWKKAGSPTLPKERLIHLVIWKDAAGSTDEGDVMPVLTYAVGFLVEASTDHIKLAMESFEDGSAREYLAVPAKMVVSVLDVARITPA